MVKALLQLLPDLLVRPNFLEKEGHLGGVQLFPPENVQPKDIWMRTYLPVVFHLVHPSGLPPPGGDHFQRHLLPVLALDDVNHDAKPSNPNNVVQLQVPHYTGGRP